MSSEDIIGELMSEVEELKTKVVELSSEPATEGINYNPEGSNFNSTADLNNMSQMSSIQKAEYIMKKYN